MPKMNKTGLNFTRLVHQYIFLSDTKKEDADELRLNESTIATTVRSRLRAARIYSSSESLPVLAVNVGIIKQAFSIELNLVQSLWNPITESYGFAITWNSGNHGAHGYEGTYVLQIVGQYIDQFIDEYLAVNESACE